MHGYHSIPCFWRTLYEEFICTTVPAITVGLMEDAKRASPFLPKAMYPVCYSTTLISVWVWRRRGLRIVRYLSGPCISCPWPAIQHQMCSRRQKLLSLQFFSCWCRDRVEPFCSIGMAWRARAHRLQRIVVWNVVQGFFKGSRRPVGNW